MASCNFYFYHGCVQGYCAQCKTLVGATRDLVKRHSVDNIYPRYILSTVPNVRGSEWKYPIVENDLTLSFDLINVNVCGVCGLAKARNWSERKVMDHIAEDHGERGQMLKGRGYCIPRRGVLLKTLNAAHVARRVRQLHPRKREEGDQDDEDNNEEVGNVEVAEVAANEVTNEVEDDLSHLVRHYLAKCSNEYDKLPPPKRVKMISSGHRAGNPALYDLGIFDYNEDISQQRLEELASHSDVQNYDEIEHLLARAFVHIIRNVPGLLLDTNLQIRKVLWTVDLTNLAADTNETEMEIPMLSPSRGFSEVTAKTLSKYVDIGIRLVISTIRIISFYEPNHNLQILRLTRDIHQMRLDSDESADKVVPHLLAFLKQVTEHRPERGQPLLFIALKSLCIHRPFNAWCIRPIHQVAYILAGIKYCLGGVHLNLYFGQIDANSTLELAMSYIKSWTKSLFFSILNSTIEKAKRMKQPQKQKCEVQLRSFRDVRLILSENPDDTITLTDIREGIELGFTLVREKLLFLFKEDVRAYFYPSEEKNIQLVYIDGILHFVDQTPDTQTLLTKAFESIDEEASNEDEILDEECKKQRIIQRLKDIQYLLIALTDIAGDGHRRAAEFSCFYNREKGFGDIFTFLRPGAYSIGDIRRISKRHSSDRINLTKSRIRHTPQISNLLLIWYHFGIKILKEFSVTDNFFDRFFPLFDVACSYLLEDVKIKHGGPSTICNSKYKIEIADYSGEYSKMINLGLVSIFPRHKITMQKLREMHGLMQNEVEDDKYQVWQGFYDAMSTNNQRYFAEASGHSVQTRKVWYTAHPSINGSVNPVMQHQDAEIIADKFSYIALGITPLVTTVIPPTIRLGPVPNVASGVLATRGYQQPKCPEQWTLIQEVYQLMTGDGRTSTSGFRSIIASLACGSGKSFAIDTALMYKQPGDIIPLILPTHVLINQKFNDYLNRGYTIRQFNQDFNSWSATDLLICTMDAAFSQSFIDAMVLYSSRIPCIIIDECHVLLDSTFRARMYRAEFLITHKMPLILLSGTLPKSMHQCLTTRFLLKDPVLIANNLIRRNMVYDVRVFDVRDEKLNPNIERMRFVDFSINKIRSLQQNKILVVCSTILLVNIFVEQQLDDRDIWGIHSEFSDEQNDKTLRDFDEKGGVLFSTAALGEGINILGLDHVFIVGTAYNMLKLVQYASRAGRGDDLGYCHILYHMTEKGVEDELREDGLCNLVPLQFHSEVKHFLTESGFRDWVLNSETCRLQSLALEFGEPASGDCNQCDVCRNRSTNQDNQDVAERIKKNKCKAIVKKILKILTDICILCGMANCLKSPGSKCNASFRRIEDLAKSSVQLGHGNVFVRSCSHCAQCWPGAPTHVRRLEDARKKHNQDAMRLGGNGGICSQLPRGDGEAFPCYHCFLPHSFTPVGGHLEDYVARRLRNVILLVARDAAVASYIQTKLNVRFGEVQPFNTYFINLLKIIETSEYGPIPLSILIINRLVNIEGYKKGKALASYDFTYEKWSE